MRPRYLDIEGLQSFKELQSIDFDRLSETGLFGIFGPTGSGKSTILDAITLALYGNVQRANRGTQGIINTDMTTMRVAFTFDLSKGRLKKTYRVERAYKRKKDTENGVEAKLSRLLEITEEGGTVLADKQGEVNEAVIGLLGLSFDDFTRSVVLPQNKFQEFLLSPKAEKTKMLERIFYLEEYGKRLTEKVAKKLAAERRRLAGIQGAMAVLGDASEEALKTAEAEMEAARVLREKADAGLLEAERQFQRAKEIWDIQSELAVIREAELSHLSKTEDYNGWKSTYDRAMQAEGLADRIAGYRKAETRLKAAEKELAELDVSLGRLKAVFERAQADYDAKSSLSRERMPGLVAYKTRLQDAQKIQKESADIEKKLEGLRQTYVRLKKGIEEKKNEAAGEKAELVRIEANMQDSRSRMEGLKIDAAYRSSLQQGIKHEEELKHAGKNKAESEAQWQELKARTAALEQELAQCVSQGRVLSDRLDRAREEKRKHQEGKPADKNELAMEETRYFYIRSILDALKTLEKEIENLEMRKGKQKEAQAQTLNRLEEVQLFVRQQHSKIDNLKAEIEEEKKRYSKHAAYLLALELTDGMPCPVCGSPDHPCPAGTDNGEDAVQLEEKLERLQKQLQMLEQECKNSESEGIRLQEQQYHLQEQFNELDSNIGKRTAEYDNERNKLPEDYRQLDIRQAEEALAAARILAGEKHKEAEAWERQLETYDEELKKLEEAWTAQQVEKSARHSTLEANKQHLEQAERVLKGAEAAYSGKLEAYQAFTKSLGIADVRSEIVRIQDSDKQYEALQHLLVSLDREAAARREALEKLSDVEQQFAREQADVDAEGRSLREQQNGLKNKLETLLEGKDLNAELDAAEKAISDMTKEEHAAHLALAEAKAQYDAAAVRYSVLEGQRDIYKKNVESEDGLLQKELKGKGFQSVEDAERALLPAVETERLRLGIEAYENEKKKLEAQKSVLVIKLGDRQITAEQWEEACLAYSRNKEERDNSIARYEGAKNGYSALKSKYETWKSLDKELKLYNHKEQMLVQIQKLLKGNSFIEFISEERLRYIAKEASETLGTLTKHRYALELDTENGFVVCDNANGGVHRLVTTLSGGETFLTSLALALALSSQIQLKGQSPLEFFFLDEGFGTLDNNLLDAVVDALERLSTTNRVIGLISHVPELKNRMVRRLIVTASAADSSGSGVRIEKA